jgi:hypothetical protein
MDIISVLLSIGWVILVITVVVTIFKIAKDVAYIRDAVLCIAERVGLEEVQETEENKLNSQE